MKIRKLNLHDAFRLASVLSKYVDINSVSPETDAIDFISDIIGKISPDEYLHCVMLMTNTTEEDVKREISLVVLNAFIRGLKENQVVSLLSFYKFIGIKDGISPSQH